MKYVSKKNDFPKGLHFVILEFGSIMTPGYEKNDPDESVPHLSYTYTTDRAEWEKEIQRLELSTGYSRKDYVAFVVDGPAQVKTSVSVIAR